MPMPPTATDPFNLPDRLAGKADPALIADDEQHFAAIAECLDRSIADLSTRLDTTRRTTARRGQEALDRDEEVHRLTARLRALRRFGLDLCLGRVVTTAGTAVYIGRFGLTDATGRRLLTDWRSPAAEPFFAASHGNPMGLASRRRYRWTRGRVADYWDEVFAIDGDGPPTNSAALDDQSAFIASLATSRSARMRDVLATIAADQDAIIRAGSRGALVVDGGPGTGKTVVALHRAAYLLYSDPHLGHRRGGVLVVGPHEPYLAYVADVLPSLGEEGVSTSTLAGLVPEGATAPPEAYPETTRLKADARMVAAVEPAVGLYEKPPTEPLMVETPWADVLLTADDWAEAFEAPEPGTPHNEAREAIWEAVVEILIDRHVADEVPASQVRAALERTTDLTRTVNRAWPMLEPTELVGDLWEVPAYLRMCAPWLTPDQARLLHRENPAAWTTSDLSLLDAARRRLGDPDASRRVRRREAELAVERERRADVVGDLIASDDSEMLVMSMLRGQDLKDALIDGSALPGDLDPDPLDGPFAHVIVDEAQEVTAAQWQMLLARCPSRSFTIVGDRAQARHGFTETWHERLTQVGFDRIEHATLSVNYRTPQEIMAEAEPVIRAALPDANVPISIRRTGVPVQYGSVAQRDEVVEEWLADHADGIAAVIGDPLFTATDRVRSLTPELAKGLEFDLVVLVEPDSFGRPGSGIEGAVDQYVSMTRATQRLVVLTG